MLEKTTETKVLRDPVHGYIHVDDQLIWDLINTGWMQRLRRIRQLGGAYMVYHCAEHTRFSHSLGVYEIVRRMLNEIPDLAGLLDEREKIAVMAAALLHDVGHGPFSHAFEEVGGISHEAYTQRIISEDTEITRLLEATFPGLAKETADILNGSHPRRLLCQLISSQLDGDRMDYLIRDAYFTGARYGDFDLERIMRTLRVAGDNRLLVKQSGVEAVENYIMARYHMYWQVYYHPTARSYEYCLHALFRRLKDLRDTDPALLPELSALIEGGPLKLDIYFRLDEETMAYGFQKLLSHHDKIVADFADRLLNRHLFAYTDRTDASLRRIRRALGKAGLDPTYYLGRDAVRSLPYVPYTGTDRDNCIFVLKDNGETAELSRVSNVVYALTHGPTRDDKKIFYPAGIAAKKK